MKAITISITRIILAVWCSTAAWTFAESAPPAATPSAPACTLADISEAMASDPNCSLQNTVVYGAEVVDFVTAQCAPFAAEGGRSDEKSRNACMRCAKDAWTAFVAAAKAKLITARPKKQNLGQLKKICNLNGGDGNGGGDDSSDSEAMQRLYSQLKLCFPQEGQTGDPDVCSSCAVSALTAALSNGAINQSKFNVMKTSLQAACARQGRGGNQPTPAPLPTPNNGENSFRKYGQGLKACFEQYITDRNRDAEGCLRCINSVDATGLDPAHVSQYLTYATNYCNGTAQPSAPGGE